MYKNIYPYLTILILLMSILCCDFPTGPNIKTNAGQFTEGPDGAPADWDINRFSSPHLKKVLKKLKKGETIDVNEQDEEGKTPLQRALQEPASQTGREKAITYLLKQGANPNIADEHGETLLMHAAQQYTWPSFGTVLLHNKELAIDQQDQNGNTALMHAIRKGKIEATKQLLLRNPNTNLQDNQGYTPLARHIRDQWHNSDFDTSFTTLVAKTDLISGIDRKHPLKLVLDQYDSEQKNEALEQLTQKMQKDLEGDSVSPEKKKKVVNALSKIRDTKAFSFDAFLRDIQGKVDSDLR